MYTNMTCQIQHRIAKLFSLEAVLVETSKKFRLLVIMGRKRCETTESERKIIIRLHNQCKSLSEIQKIVNRSRSTIHSIIDRYGERKTLVNKSRNGRPRKIDEHVGRIIIRKIKRNPRISAEKIVAELQQYNEINVCASTVRNFLRSNEYHGRVARKKFYVSETNRKKRLEFARQHVNTSMNFWNRVIFTDESKFDIFGTSGHFKVWRKKIQRTKKKFCVLQLNMVVGQY